MNAVSDSALVKPKFSIVLVNYKTYQMTLICLKLLHKAFEGTEVQVWVVDNDSKDESTAYLRTLDWIHFIERTPVVHDEPGFMAHGRALDMVLERVTTDYLFLLHTDTLIHNPDIFDMMLNKCIKNDIAAVGCVDQIYRGQLRIIWRFVSRFLQHYSRRLKLGMGFKSREPKPFYEEHLKSFCALWNVKIMKENGLTFMLNERTPGYEAQDQLVKLGYKISYLSAKKMFGYLDHVEAATVSAQGIYGKNHRRTKKYNDILQKMSGI